MPSDALARWRARCERAIATGEGLTERERSSPAVIDAIRSCLQMPSGTSPHQALFILAKNYGRLTPPGQPDAPGVSGVLIACIWLREELERDGGES